MIKKQLLAIAALTSVTALPLAQADELTDQRLPLAQADELTDNRWYVAPFGTYINAGGDRNSNDGWGGGMGFGKMLDEHFNVELKGFYQSAGGDNGNGAWDLTGGTADVQYFFSRDVVSPYAVLGLGGMNTSHSANIPGFSGGSGITFIGEAGAGLTYELHDNFLIRSDVRYRYNNNFNAQLQPGTDEFHDMTVNLGFVIPFGPKPTAAQYEAPAPVPVAPVVDCSTLDDDVDGVNNCLDKCPGTMSGSKVDFEGCPVSLELKGVNFKYDSAELTIEAMAILDTVAQNLIAYPEKDDLEVRGHTSSEGSDSYNMKLSQRRSQSVVDYLSMKGVSNRLTARGYGENQPIADNTTEEGRSQNRRVELIWMGN
ncbi:MAG: OmpA family protein [Methylococcaceae bacterium]